MSVGREPATRGRIELFLQRLGRTFRGSGRLYLVGGTMMVYDGFRQQTQDVDYALEMSPSDEHDFVAAVVRLKRELNLNVEPAAPGDFIPLPSGWQERSRFLERYGALDVFAFDPVSTALSKLARGLTRDVDDVLALLAAGTITTDQLRDAFAEIVPRLAQESVRTDEDDFRRKLDAFMVLAEQRHQ